MIKGKSIHAIIQYLLIRISYMKNREKKTFKTLSEVSI